MKKLHGYSETGIKKGEIINLCSLYKKNTKIISGWEYVIVTLMIGLHVLWLALLRYKNPRRAFSLASSVIRRRKDYKNTHKKIVKRDQKYYKNLYSPGWPSEAFNRYIYHYLNVYSPHPEISLFAIAFAITNKCGFHCEHCVEWEQLNRKDNLTADELVDIIIRFHQVGVSQVQLSGGEPLNRLNDIIYILDSIPEGIDFWMYTNGYNLSAEKAKKLKDHGLTGVIISLDHHEPEKHDKFRGIQGSFEKVIDAARNVTDNGLLLAFSCCVTNDFASNENLVAYAKICRKAGASFIQLMEPEPVGRYKKKNVTLTKENIEILEQFFYLMNFDDSFSDFPIVSYPAMLKRLNGCQGTGLHFLYIDADGDILACPFCRKKLFHATVPYLQDKIHLIREKGCPLIEIETKPDHLKKNKLINPVEMEEEVFV